MSTSQSDGGSSQPPNLNAWQLVNRIQSALGSRSKDAMYEGIITPAVPDFYGPLPGLRVPDIEAPISAVLVANEPSVDVIRFAVATGKNCIVCREHPYYLFGEFWAAGLDVRLAKDPILNAKRQLIEAHNLVIIRLANLWDTARPKWFSSALARALGWTPEAADPGDRTRVAYCDVPKGSFVALAESISARLQTRNLRMVGDPQMEVSRAAVISGVAFPTLVLSQAIRDSAVNVIVTGTTPEVDFCTTYVRDAITAGNRLGLVQVGLDRSDYPGSMEVADWLRKVLPGLPIGIAPAAPDACWLA